MRDRSSDGGRTAAIVALAATLYFLVAAVATHLVSTQYDPVRDYISDYAVGPHGWIYSSAFLASCIGCIALAVALWVILPIPARSPVGLILLAEVGLTYAIDFYFPTEILAPGAPPQTRIGEIHLVAALIGWVAFIVAAFLIAGRLQHDPRFKHIHAAAVTLSWLAAALFVLLIAVVVAKLPIGGLVEKAFILDRNVWALVLTIAALRAVGVTVAPAGLRADRA
jgi:hypothetical protein